MADIHSNDRGIATGDEAFFMVYGWIPVRVRVLEKHATGFARSFTVELLDYESPSASNYRPPDWRRKFIVGVKRMANSSEVISVDAQG